MPLQKANALPTKTAIGPGSFDDSNVTLLPPSGVVSGSNSLISLTLAGGDYNASGILDAADYVVWRTSVINGLQGYNVWRSNFGLIAGSASGASFIAAIPEPATMRLLVIPFLMACCRRRVGVS